MYNIKTTSIHWEGFRTYKVISDLCIGDMPEGVRDMLLNLVLDTFQIIAIQFDPSMRWSMDGGYVWLDYKCCNENHDSPLHSLPDDVFIDVIRDTAIDAVKAPVFGTKMSDGLSSPLQNKVEEILLYLPEGYL